MKNSRPTSRSISHSPSDIVHHLGPPVPQTSECRSSGDCCERAPSPAWASHDENKGQSSVTRHSFSSPSATARENMSPESSSRPRGAEGNPPSKNSTAKRIRRESSSASQNSKDRSSPDSDSQGGMADNEMESTTTKKTEHTLPAPPPKRKRTRTLTTPRQSAVLHALLAQSRFPTTAMREEVGRSIGLSARKVQIWFQNQRQKARRPRNQTDVIINRPPQYGSLPNVAESSLSVHRYRGARTHYSGHPPQGTSAVSSGNQVRLLGPGIPGQHQINIYRQVHQANIPASESSFGPAFSQSAGSQSHSSAMPSAQPAPDHPAGLHERATDSSQTLPPLLPTRPISSHALPSFWALPAFTPHRSVHTRQSLSPEQRFIQYLSEPAVRPRLNIPPPFTLQPAPQWDDSSYYPRPTSSPWSQSRLNLQANRGRSTSPIVPRRESTRNVSRREARSEPYYTTQRSSILHSSQQSGPSMSIRPGRYDPVRAIFITSSPTLDGRDDIRSPNNGHEPLR